MLVYGGRRPHTPPAFPPRGTSGAGSPGTSSSCTCPSHSCRHSYSGTLPFWSHCAGRNLQGAGTTAAHLAVKPSKSLQMISGTFTALTGEGVVVIPRRFVPTNHTQLILASALAPYSQAGPPPKGQLHGSTALNRAPAEGIRAWLAGPLQTDGATLV